MRAVKRTVCLLLSCALLVCLLGCGSSQANQEVSPEQTENLVKLCKVWGYVKYTHPAFLLGKLDWDTELLELVPKVQAAKSADEVNTLLHEWFQSLGEIDYGETPGSKKLSDSKRVVVADTAWTTDAVYLGEDLVEDLAQLPESLPSIIRSYAPVYFDAIGTPNFSHEPDHDAVYDDMSFRLLGLFRLWNAMEYYYPYLLLLDQDWETCLTESIPEMLAGTDQESYEWTLARLAFRLQDSHVGLFRVSDSGSRVNALVAYFTKEYLFPVPLAEAEGKLVVSESVEGYPFVEGDVLVSLNSTDIDVLTDEVKQYMCYTRDEVLLARTWPMITTSETADMEVTVLRGEETRTFSVQASDSLPDDADLPLYEILDGGIGLIHPGEIGTTDDAQEVMEALGDTQALIVDLRQYPGAGFTDLYCWIAGENVPYFVIAKPWSPSPGTYGKATLTTSLYASFASLYPVYDKPVIVLMDNTSMSYGETSIMALSEGENVVLMGENSMGSNGNVVYLPLPGSLSISFSSLGVYTVDGEQTQRTGIAPDIRVEPTIQGIAEGRDDLMDAAIAYLQQ